MICDAKNPVQQDLVSLSEALVSLVGMREQTRHIVGPEAVKAAKRLDRAIRDVSKTKSLVERTCREFSFEYERIA